MSNPDHFSHWIIYEDDCLLAINKPSGILSVPGKPPNPTPCVQDYFPSQHTGLLTIHRLDMDTSGILLLAKTKQSHRFMSMAFQNRQTSKVYQAVCAGKLEHPEGLIQLPMRCDWAQRPRQCIDFVQGRYAQTRWQIIAQDEQHFRVTLFPITGRSHQLRLHMKMLGHPILGDTLYADLPAQQASSRLLLHASQLSFKHPISQTPIELTNQACFI